jgi:membrane dipeptidase
LRNTYLSSSEEVRALEVHKKSIVVLTHIDTVIYWSPKPIYTPPYFDLKPWQEQMSLGKRTKFGHVDIPRMMEGGINCPVFAICVTTLYKPERALMRSMEMLDAYYNEITKNQDKILLALTTEEILKAKKDGKISSMLSIEGGESIEGNLAALRMIHKLGVRIFGLTHNNRNQIGDGIGEARTRGGLTEFGVQLVEALNRLGIIVDVSHLSDNGFWDVIETSKAPIIASHSNSRKVCDISRNLTDDQIKALSESGGVVGINFWLPSIAENDPDLEKVLDHIDHISELVGVDYIGLGSDFDGFDSQLPGLEDASKIPNITRGLVKRGYSDNDINKILGANFLRVFKEVID